MGRPLGRKTNRSIAASRDKTAKLITEGKSPLDRLIADMNWWAKEVDQLESQIRNDPESLILLKGESILKLEREGMVKNYFDARATLHEVTLDAAQYVHPTFKAVAIGVTPGQAQEVPKTIENEPVDAIERRERAGRSYLALIKGGRAA